MNIPPPSSGGTPRAGAGRIGNTAPTRPERRPENPSDGARGASDRLELSPDAISLQWRGEIESAPVGELTPERLRLIGERLAADHYDRPEVRDQVLRGLIAELDAAIG